MENKEKIKGLVFDIDGTLCPIKSKEEKYEDLVPYQEMIDKLREYKEQGFKIILQSARNMNSYKGNQGLINANTLPTLINWLNKWNIPYDEIYMSKPWPGHIGYYIDDRAIRPREFLEKTPEELDEIISRDRKIQE